MNMETLDITRHSSGVTFEIVLDENVSKPVPKRVLEMKRDKKKMLTADDIEYGQKMAEQRRQARIAARLKRMQEREESTRRLVSNVDVLLQQQLLRSGQIGDSESLLIMSQQEILKTACDVVKDFKELQQQLLSTDLKVDTESHNVALGSSPQDCISQKPMISSPNLSHKKPVGVVSSNKGEQKLKGIAFEISFDESESSKPCSKKPAIANLQKKHMKVKDQELMAEKLKEKMRKATECREKKQADRVRKTRESREAFTELRSKVNIFQRHQAALENQGDPSCILSKQEAARIALDIADGFSTIHSRYKVDLEKAEDFFDVMQGKTL